jgi:hypothetical protein
MSRFLLSINLDAMQSGSNIAEYLGLVADWLKTQTELKDQYGNYKYGVVRDNAGNNIGYWQVKGTGNKNTSPTIEVA